MEEPEAMYRGQIADLYFFSERLLSSAWITVSLKNDLTRYFKLQSLLI